MNALYSNYTDWILQLQWTAQNFFNLPCATTIITIFYYSFSKHCSCHHSSAYSSSSTPYRPFNPNAISFFFCLLSPHFPAMITSTIHKSYTIVPQGFRFSGWPSFLAVPLRFITILLYRTLSQVSFPLKTEFYLLFPYITDNPILPSTHLIWVNTASAFHVWILAYAACHELLFFQGLYK